MPSCLCFCRYPEIVTLCRGDIPSTEFAEDKSPLSSDDRDGLSGMVSKDFLRPVMASDKSLQSVSVAEFAI